MWKHARSILQIGLLVVAAAILVDGFFGEQAEYENLAGTLPWIHWRGFAVLTLLVAGNLFCMACPFMLPRRLAKAWLPSSRPWPPVAKGKWAALALFLLFIWSYEAFDIWASPLLTAWVAVAYFSLAFVVDGFFRGAAFCKHVCPIGQFNFYGGTLSPLEVSVRVADVCGTCRSKDCIRGVRAPIAASGGSGPALQNGCELYLFQPRKLGNIDCTFCLDCVQACPHDNVGIHARLPVRELWLDPVRSGIGRLSQRRDLAALVIVMTFAGLLNAFGMVQPVYGVREWVAVTFGITSDRLVTAAMLLGWVGLGPALLIGTAASLSRRLGGLRLAWTDVATRMSYSLVPVGFAVWAAHHFFHLMVGARSVVPVAQVHLASLAPARVPPPTTFDVMPLLSEGPLYAVEVGILTVGWGLSCLVAFKILQSPTPMRRSLLAAAPFWAASTFIAVLGAWILAQPMEMRGVLGG